MGANWVVERAKSGPKRMFDLLIRQVREDVDRFNVVLKEERQGDPQRYEDRFLISDPRVGFNIVEYDVTRNFSNDLLPNPVCSFSLADASENDPIRIVLAAQGWEEHMTLTTRWNSERCQEVIIWSPNEMVEGMKDEIEPDELWRISQYVLGPIFFPET